MQQLTPQGQQVINDVAQRYGVSTDAVMTLLQALINGQGKMAQFNHRELGGSGQWMRGGMTLVGDMFNNALKAKVDSLCSELAALLINEPLIMGPMGRQWQGQGSQQQQNYYPMGEVSLFVSAPQGGLGHWWPADLGMPAATGAQNAIRYAYFPGQRRLAIEINGKVTVYDTLDHRIEGVSQQQAMGASLTFISQQGRVRITDLPVVSDEGGIQGKRPVSSQPDVPATPRSQEGDIFVKIERLAELKDKGILSEEEFAAKKAELLSKL